MSGVAVVLAATAAVAGITGTWSPCGLSMVETLGRPGGRRTTLAACATFAVGALVGGVVTFGGLALVGRALHAGIGSGALAVAAAVAAVAAYAEARGLRVLPQIRRQVPEPWRRVMPLPLAAGLYGVLLGLGFTTFVLTVATWALAGLSLAIGEPWVGAVIGLAFGAGRALPVVLIAPRLGRPMADRLMGAMLERPRFLQALRLGDAIGLVLVAAFLSTTPALAASGVPAPATDPSTGGSALAWQQPGTGGFIRAGGTTKPVPGDDPALSSPYLAYRNGDQATVVRRSDRSVVMTQTFAGLSKLAVSRNWLAVRVNREGGGDRILVQRIEAGSQPFSGAATKGPDQLGRPALDGNRLVYVRSGPTGSRLVRITLADGPQDKTILRKSDTSQYLSVAAAGGRILYVRSYRCSQSLSLMDSSGKNDRVITKGPGPAGTDGCGHGGTPPTFWTVALAPKTAYLTKLASHKNGRPTPSIVSYGL